MRAYLTLTLADGVGPRLFARLVKAFGTAEAAIAAGPSRWRTVEGVGPKVAAAIGAVTDERVADELAAAERFGATILCDSDEQYPPALKHVADHPPVLYVRGRLEPADAVALAVVGARRCTHYGLEQAGRFAELLARAGLTVVSGGARGIDTAAHRAALTAGGRTIAVMGCGLAMCYPSENAELFERIIASDQGAVVSELPMATGVQGRNFPRRNRIISGLSLGVLLIEAARRSGALITATEAAEQGRDVFAVPGRVDSPMSEGTNALIRDGAILAAGLDDILRHLGQVGERIGLPAPVDTPAVPAGLTPVETALAEALREGELAIDALARRAGVTSAEAVSAMTMMVLKGVVIQRPGNVFALARRKGRQ